MAKIKIRLDPSPSIPVTSKRLELAFLGGVTLVLEEKARRWSRAKVKREISDKSTP